MQYKDMISSEKSLRGIVGHYPKMLDKRILSKLDQHCIDYLCASKFCIVSIDLASDRHVFLSPSISSNLSLNDAKKITLNIDKNEQGILASSPLSSHPCSLYLLIPGVEFGLRINGSCHLHGNSLCIYISQAYVHCARAAVRSKLWHKSTNTAPITSASEFIKKSFYALLCTKNSKSESEISPRGDLGPVVFHTESGCLLLPERPGNKVAVSLRNILQNPKVTLCLLIPGQASYLVIHATAYITNNPALLSALAIKGKIPKLAIHLSPIKQELKSFPAFDDNNIWCPEHHVDEGSLPPFPKILSEHMHGTGLHGKVTTKLVHAVVKHDRKHLY